MIENYRLFLIIFKKGLVFYMCHLYWVGRKFTSPFSALNHFIFVLFSQWNISLSLQHSLPQLSLWSYTLFLRHPSSTFFYKFSKRLKCVWGDFNILSLTRIWPFFRTFRPLQLITAFQFIHDNIFDLIIFYFLINNTSPTNLSLFTAISDHFLINLFSFSICSWSFSIKKPNPDQSNLTSYRPILLMPFSRIEEWLVVLRLSKHIELSNLEETF